MAVTSGTLAPGGGYEGRSLKMTWSRTSYSVAGNYSIISWTLSAVGGSSSFYYHHKEKLWIYGAWRYNNTTNTKRYKGTIASGTIQINHDSTGKASFGAELYGAIYTSSQNVSGSGTWTLPDIPRVSDLSLDKTSVPADGTTEVIATATKKSDSFTDTITVKLGDYSKTVTSGTAFTIPQSWINAIPTTSATAVVTVTTKSGSTTIGSKTANLMVMVPDSVKPVINEIGTAEAASKVTTAFGERFVKGLSQLNVTVDADGIYGSTINSYSTTVDGVTYIQQAFTSNVINTVGELSIKTKVTDSRGRSAELTKTVNVIDYMPPVITGIDYYYCDSDGNRDSSGGNTKVTISYKVYPVDSQNTKALKLSYRKVTDEKYTERALTLTDWEGTVETIIAGTSADVTYEYTAEITDKITSSQSTVMTGINVMSFKAGGDGVTVFGEAEEAGFVVKGGKSATFTGDILMEVDEEFQTLWTSVFGSSGGVVKLLDFIFHKGYIIATKNADFDPNNFMPWQTWEKVAQGRTLYGAGTLNGITYTAGKTVNAGLPDITGSIGSTGSGEPKFSNSVSGCFSAIAKTSYYSQTTDKSGYTRTDGINFKASGSNSIYGGSNTVQPNAYVVYMWERTA